MELQLFSGFSKVLPFLIIIITFLIFVLIITIYKAKIKGIFGEKGTSFFLSQLDKNKYLIINDVMVEVEGKTSQIDHLVVSNYGVFIIETKNYQGWILGDDKSQY